MVWNIVLSLVKIIAGTFSTSISLVADGIHSLSDLFTDVLVFLGSHFGEMPPDEKHPYGHGKLETIVAIVIGAVLVSVGGGVLWRSFSAFGKSTTTAMETPIIVVSILSIIVKEYLFRKTRSAAKKTNSPSLYANAWHHRSDAISSFAVMFGGVAIYYGWPLGDAFAGLVVGLLVVFSGLKIVFDSFSQLSECSIDEQSLEQIRSLLKSNEDILSYSTLRTRTVGREIFVDFIIKVDSAMNIVQAHNISNKIENQIQDLFNNPVNIIIHIEPFE